jgi:hypothetical protein
MSKTSRSTGLVIEKDGKWLVEDMRYYVVDTNPPKTTQPPVAMKPTEPNAPKEPPVQPEN